MKLLLENLLLFSVQMGVVVLAGGFVSQFLKQADPRARLLHWQMVLLAGFVFPFFGRWETPVDDAVSITVGMARAWNTPTAPVTRPVPWVELLAGILALGAVLFLGRLALGLVRIGL